MNIYRSIVLGLLCPLVACTTDSLQDEDIENEAVHITATMGVPLTKVNDEGTAFELNDKFHLYNMASGLTTTNTNRYALYLHTGDIDKPCSSIAPLYWKNLQKDGGKYWFTATSNPEITAVETDQSNKANYKKSDYLIARKVCTAADKWKTITLDFKHVLCRIDVEVQIPVGPLDFSESNDKVLSSAVFVNRVKELDITYSTSTGDGEIIPVKAKGEVVSEMLPLSKGSKISTLDGSKYRVYTYSIIIPNQAAGESAPFARFVIDGKKYTYKPSNAHPVTMEQGKITTIVLKLVKSDATPLNVVSVKVTDWKTANADIGEIEPNPRP